MDKLFEATWFEKRHFDDFLLTRLEAIINKVNEIVEVINSLEYDNSLMSSIQERGGSDA